MKRVPGAANAEQSAPDTTIMPHNQPQQEHTVACDLAGSLPSPHIVAPLADAQLQAQAVDEQMLQPDTQQPDAGTAQRGRLTRATQALTAKQKVPPQ